MAERSIDTCFLCFDSVLNFMNNQLYSLFCFTNEGHCALKHGAIFLVPFVLFSKITTESVENGSTDVAQNRGSGEMVQLVKHTCCSYRGPSFYSLPHAGSQSSVT